MSIADRIWGFIPRASGAAIAASVDIIAAYPARASPKRDFEKTVALFAGLQVGRRVWRILGLRGPGEETKRNEKAAARD